MAAPATSTTIKIASSTSPSTSTTPGPQTTPISSSTPSIRSSRLNAGVTAGFSILLVVLIVALAFGAIVFIRRRRRSSLPRGIQPALPFDNNAHSGTEHKTFILADKPYVGGSSSPTVETHGNRKDVGESPYTVQTDDVRARGSRSGPEHHTPSSYFPLTLHGLPTRKASPRPEMITRDFIPPTTKSAERLSAHAELPADVAPTPYVWTRGRTLSRDIVDIPVK